METFSCIHLSKLFFHICKPFGSYAFSCVEAWYYVGKWTEMRHAYLPCRCPSRTAIASTSWHVSTHIRYILDIKIHICSIWTEFDVRSFIIWPSRMISIVKCPAFGVSRWACQGPAGRLRGSGLGWVHLNRVYIVPSYLSTLSYPSNLVFRSLKRLSN